MDVPSRVPGFTHLPDRAAGIRMKIAVVALSLLALSLPAKAETIDVDTACTFDGIPFRGRLKTQAPDARIQRITQAILSTVGLGQNVRVRAAEVPNAAALVQGETRYVLYSASFLDGLNRRVGTDWAGISVLAHEIGHHLGGHTLDDKSSDPVTELEADRFSGFVLARLGASLDEAQAAMQLMGSRRGTTTHPARNARLEAIRDGWEQADAPLPLGLVPGAPEGEVTTGNELVKVRAKDSFTRVDASRSFDARELPRITPGLTLPPSRRHALPETGITGASRR